MVPILPATPAHWQYIAAVLLAVSLPACASWHVGTPTPAAFIEREHPQAVRVTRTDGTTLTLDAPTVRGDSLTGTAGGGVAREDTIRVISLPLTDVRQVEVSRTSTGRTLGLVGGILAVAVGILLIAYENTDW